MTTEEQNQASGTGDPPMPPPGYTAQIFNSTLPPPQAEVAKCFNSESKEEQLKNAEDLYSFLVDTTSNMLELNGDATLRVAMLNLPKSAKVKLIFCGGMGSSGIGKTSPIDKKLLWLNGDGGPEIGAPTAITIPAEARDSNKVACMSEEVFEQRLRDKGGASYTWPLATRNNVTTSEEVMQICPIPAFLVFDGFEVDIDAALILERVLTSAHKDTPMMVHASKFLRCCLSSHNSGDNKPYLQHETLLALPSTAARKWAASRFKECFPSLTTQQSNQANPNQTNFQNIINPLIQAQLQQLQLFQTATTTQQNNTWHF